LVLKARSRTRTLPALVVPDERSWVMWGHDLAAVGFTAAASPEDAAAVLLPTEVPEALVQGLIEAVRRVPGTPRALTLSGPLAGQAAPDVLATARRPPAPSTIGGAQDGGMEAMHGHGGGAEDGDHGQHHGAEDAHDAGESCGHGGQGGDGESEEPWASNMMPIAGSPSSDGLVMDDVELVLGPLGPPLPGGLIAGMAFDGEVVSRCALTASLQVARERVAAGDAPDPLAPAAWRAALALAGAVADRRGLSEATRRTHVAAVEVERALSHAVSARELGRALGWRELVDVAGRAVDGCMRARKSLVEPDASVGALDTAGLASERVLALVDRSRRLASRTRGRATLTSAQLTAVAGSVARAAGVQVDARLGDPLYEALGFVPVTLSGGDAEARTVLRATEACQALRLAAAAIREHGGDADVAAPPSGAVEGPRGPVRMSAAGPAAPGTGRLLRAAGDACRGESWSRAVVALVSFDLSPWRVAS
jgi:hypothetical protein